MNNKIIEMVSKYQPYNTQEVKDKELILNFLNQFEDVLTRNNIIGHFTTSCWIVNSSLTKVLCIYHKIYNSWGWVGGHNDGDEDFINVALKEAKEETGLNIEVLDNEIFAIDILPVMNHFKKGEFISSHLHLNLTYLCIADENEKLVLNTDETEGVMWIDINRINDYVSVYDDKMKMIYSKLNEKLFKSQDKYLK